MRYSILVLTLLAYAIPAAADGVVVSGGVTVAAPVTGLRPSPFVRAPAPTIVPGSSGVAVTLQGPAVSPSSAVQVAPAVPHITVTPVIEAAPVVIPAVPAVPSVPAIPLIVAGRGAVSVSGGYYAAPPVTYQSAPASVVVYQPAPPPPPIIIYQQAPPPPPVIIYQQAPAPPPPPMVVITPVPSQNIAIYPGRGVIEAAPVPVVQEYQAQVTDAEYFEEEDDGFLDLEVFGVYQRVFDDEGDGLAELGGVRLETRFLLGDYFSVAGNLGYLNGGTEAGGNQDEVPFGVNLMWYPGGHDFPLYFSWGVGGAWVSRWSEAPSIQGESLGGSTDDRFLLSAQTAVGLEITLFDFLVLTGEVAGLVRGEVDGGSGCDYEAGWSSDGGFESDGPEDMEYGVSANLGLGIRF